MSQKAQIRECTIEELYATPAQPPQQPSRVIPITASRSATTSQQQVNSSAATPSATPPLIVSPVPEKTFLQKNALLITITVVVAIGVGIYLYQRKKKKEESQ